MEPRPRGRGREPRATSRAPYRQLQWSPDLAVGEGRARRRSVLPCAALQWSPDLAVGEGGRTSPAPRSSSCFNGAPTSRSGKATFCLDLYRTYSRLQWSPDLAVGEGRIGDPRYFRRYLLQWSPDLAVGEGTAGDNRRPR